MLAKKLLAQAGYPKGFKVTLTLPKYHEEPQLAQILAASAKKIGIDIKLNIMTYTAVYAGTYTGGKTGRGSNPWLNSPMFITDYGHRAVPNVFLGSAFKTGGVWNAANYSNKAFDKAVDAVYGRADAERAAQVRRDRTADPAQGHPGDHPLLLQLDAGRVEEGQGLRPGRDRDAVPVEDVARVVRKESFGPGRCASQRPGRHTRGRLGSPVSCSSGSAWH